MTTEYNSFQILYAHIKCLNWNILLFQKVLAHFDGSNTKAWKSEPYHEETTF